MAKNILITGASGLVGTRLTQVLRAEGHRVSHLGRTARAGDVPSFVWDIAKRHADPAAFENTDLIIHLAGAGVADKRWTAARKQEILDSRTQSSQLLYDSLRTRPHRVTAVVSASAVGYYGFDTGDAWLTEEGKPGTDFLADVTQRWEQSVEPIASLGIRVAKLRIGIVLSTEGGALAQMAKPIKMGLGAPLGSGHQYLSWIHIDDLCQMFAHAATHDSVHGVFNAVGTQPVRNREFTQTLAQVLRKPLWLPPVPAWVLRWGVGEMANIILGGNRVSSEKIQYAGFRFEHRQLESALRHLYAASR
ncbi:MAG: TIGR01777 family oxidoreductase [Cyclobacteriaceae bacterium]|jgi:hypothetical protein|nr:TIGR01777 family oxidoreductase [Cyclobacteriaceae bacterium]